MTSIQRVDNDPKHYMTITEFNYREDYLDMALIIHQYISRTGEISYMWTVLKNYPDLELRLVWAYKSWPTFGEALAEGQKELLERIAHPEIYGINMHLRE